MDPNPPVEQLDLATILARLREFSEGNSGAPEPASVTTQQPSQVVPIVTANAYENVPHQAQQISLSEHTVTPPYVSTPAPRPTSSHGIPTHRAPPQPVTPPVDPATITEWALGLRCVTKMAEINPDFKNSIQRMMVSQYKHENEWWEKREALVETISSRGSGVQSINDILSAVGGNVVQAALPVDPEKLQAELDAYDMKVYKVQLAMHKAMAVELKNLGVPFFGMRIEQLAKMKEVTLLELQRRMLDYLEDMYRP